MRLWHLARYETDNPRHDETHGYVVRAETEQEAREIASKPRGDEGPAAWLDSRRSFCVPLEHDGEPGIILRDFYSA